MFRLLLPLLLWAGVCHGQAHAELEEAFRKQQWDAVAQMAYDILKANPHQPDVALKGAYALFQRDFHNSALTLLKGMSREEWQKVPQGEDRFTEIVSLFQKKIPLSLLPGRLEQVNENRVPAYLRDEVFFAKGRAAYEKGEGLMAKAYLQKVSAASRYYAEARYILGSILIQEKKFDEASAQFSKMFQPEIFQQGAEFWEDIRTQMTSHWGANLQVLFDAKALEKTRKLGVLGLMALARLHYGKKQYEEALSKYREIESTSSHYARARLESIWTHLKMNHHGAAKDLAKDLIQDTQYFESIEAHIVKAVVLADSDASQAAREELKVFDERYKDAIGKLERYQSYGVRNSLPPFIQTDLQRDVRIETLEKYREGLLKEVKGLENGSLAMFGIYRSMASKLRLLVAETKKMEAALAKEHAVFRIADLKRLYQQSRLIRGETYLDDREALRKQYKGKKVTEAEAREHDRKLVSLLRLAVAEIDSVLPEISPRNPHLEFRHAEILWELATAIQILAQTEDKKRNENLALQLKERSLSMAKSVVGQFPTFAKLGQAKFFSGFAEIELGREEKGIQTLIEYTNQFTSHHHLPDAYRIVGDYYFDKNDFKLAEDYFLKILNFPDTPVTGYAYYKIAWCNYNTRNYARSLMGLEKAILWARERRKSGLEQVLSLTREAGNDLISVYAEFGDATKALDYYQSFVGEGTYDWISRLAARYDETGQYEKSSYLYNVLISLNGKPEENVRHYARMAQGYFRLQDWSRVLSATDELIQNYGEKLKLPQAEGSPAAEAEDSLRNIALAQHFEFSRSDEAEVAERIIALDRKYLSVFSGWKKSQTVLYTLANYLRDRKQIKQASVAYETHWEQFKEDLKEPLREESIRNLLHSLEKLDTMEQKALAAQTEESSNDKKKELEPAKLSPSAEKILKYAQFYSTHYPKTKYHRAIEFLYATMLLKYGRLQEGIVSSQKIFDENPKDDLGKQAFKNLKVAYYQAKNWKETFDWSTRLLEANTPAARSYHSDLRTVREEALFLWADNSKNDIEAAELFLRLVNDPQTKKLKEKSLYNAIVRYQKAGEKTKVLSLSKNLEATYPKSGFVRDLAGLRASHYQESGDYLSALPLLMGFLKNAKGTKEEVLQQARLNAALILQAVGKKKEAVALYHEYVAKAADPESSGVASAKGGLKYLTSLERKPASTYTGWDKVQQSRDQFIQKPLPSGKELAKRIKQGAENLDRISKELLAISSDTEAPDDIAFEAFCSVPLLYERYGKGVDGLSAFVPAEARDAVSVELKKVSDPIYTKAGEFAGECLTKSLAAGHDGSIFRTVNGQWGWEKDSKKQKAVREVLNALESRDWISGSEINEAEAKLIQFHLGGRGTPESWYALGLQRFKSGKLGLSRLTFIDAMGAFRKAEEKRKLASTEEGSGDSEDDSSEAKAEKKVTVAAKILNALAVIEWKTVKPKGVEKFFEKAVEEGSSVAYVNLATLYLQRGNITQGVEYLRKAKVAGHFDKQPGILKVVNGVLEL